MDVSFHLDFKPFIQLIWEVSALNDAVKHKQETFEDLSDKDVQILDDCIDQTISILRSVRGRFTCV